MTAEIRREVLRIFERHRAVAGTPFDESHFLDYLLANPGARRAVYNSFGGLRRYNAFIDDIQMHFGICFSGSDFDANYPLPKFVARIAEIRASRRSSMASYRESAKRGFGWHAIVIGNILAIAVSVLALRYSAALGYALAACTLAANVAFLRFYLRWSSYPRRLLVKIGQAHARDT